MSLSGSLNFVTIDEVLRLLTRSKQQGSLDVTGSGLRGRVFVGTGGIDLASIWTEDELHDHLVNSGLVSEEDLRRVTTEVTTLAAIAESNQDIVDLIREMTIESLYQIGQKGEDFIVREGATTPYASPKSFELEHLIQDAEARERDWTKVSELVPDLTGAIGFRRDLGDRDEVNVKVDDWKVLSEIGAGASVTQIAKRLGTTDFWTAKVTSRLVQLDLVEILEPATGDEEPETSPSDEPESAYEPYQTHDADTYEPAATEPETTEYEATEYDEVGAEAEDVVTEDAVTEAVQAEEPVAVADDSEDVNPNESWWQEPKDDEGDASVEHSGTPEVVGEGLSEMPTTEDDVDVEEDTEAFLEKVFSELEGAEEEPEEEAEGEEGFGLLRRRRMGSLRDFSSDS